MALLLGPPGSGKTTLLLALAGKLHNNLEVRDFRFLFVLFWCSFDRFNLPVLSATLYLNSSFSVRGG